MYVVRTRTYVCILPNLIYDANIQRGRIDDLFDNSIFEWEEAEKYSQLDLLTISTSSTMSIFTVAFYFYI